MRITGGKARGIVLKTPKGGNTRPAVDVIREALFSSLGNLVEGCQFADLFAGTGAYGLEAWSRGAESGVFVDMNPASIRCIKANIPLVAKSANTDPQKISVTRVDVMKWRSFETGSYDLVFADPPYEILPELESDLFQLADKLLSADGLFVLEKPAELNLSPTGWTAVKQLGKKRGKGPSLVFWERS